MAAAVAEMFHLLSRSFCTRNVRSAPALKSCREAAGSGGGGAPLRRPPQHLGEMLGPDLVPLDHDQQALDRVPQLADVAAPVVALERLHGGGGRRSCGRKLFSAENCFTKWRTSGPMSSRRSRSGGHADGDDVEAEVEVLAEVAPLDGLLEVLVGGGDDAHVHV